MDNTTLSNSLKSAFDTAFANTSDRDAALTALCNAIADDIKTMVMGATVTYSAGLIAPPGTAGGPVTGMSGMTIS